MIRAISVDVVLVTELGDTVVIIVGSVVDNALVYLSYSTCLTLVVEVLCPQSAIVGLYFY